jgi:hypothetical protein
VPYFHDVAGWVEVQAQRAGLPVLVMPDWYRSKYRHFGGLSWRRERGVRALRHYLRLGGLIARLWIRRLDRLNRAVSGDYSDP